MKRLMSASRRPWSPAGGALGLAAGYFICYLPFAALTKALSSGLLPGTKGVDGLVLLPAVAVGVLVGAPTFLMLSGWWRYIGLRHLFGSLARLPSGTMIAAGGFTAVIIATTFLNYTFAGVSILFMLLLMRAGTLGLAPVIDMVRGRAIHAYSWVALGFSMAAVAVALNGVDGFAVPAGALLSLGAYLAGYFGRFEIMSRVAKTGDEHIDRRYLVEEQVAAAVVLVALCACFAFIGWGPEMQALRQGFTSVAITSEALPAFAIGTCYAMLYVFGTLIYLDAREYTWAVPANRASSVLAVLAASYILTALSGVAAPPTAMLVATGFVLLAVCALSYRYVIDLVRRGPSAAVSRRIVLFVCGANTGRSPLAAAIARAELVEGDIHSARGISVTSAGVSVNRPGAPMASGARKALKEFGVRAHLHGSQQLTKEMCERSVAIYCMTEEQRRAVIAIAPAAARRTYRLDPEVDLGEPDHGSPEGWPHFVLAIRDLVRQRLAELPAASPQFAATAR